MNKRNVGQVDDSQEWGGEPDSLEVGEAWRDMYTWEETPFRSSDDVVLLSYGFHYSSSGEGMELVTPRGDSWYVNLSQTVPSWYCNGNKIGSMSYDEVVNLFSVN